MTGQVEVKIGKELVGPIVEAKIEAAICESLNEVDARSVIEKIVSDSLNRRVDNKGQISDYDHNNRYTYIQWLMHDAIKKAVQIAITKVIDSRQDTLTQVVEAELKKVSHQKRIAKLFVGSLQERAIAAAHMIEVNFTDGKDK